MDDKLITQARYSQCAPTLGKEPNDVDIPYVKHHGKGRGIRLKLPRRLRIIKKKGKKNSSFPSTTEKSPSCEQAVARPACFP
ncbi:hypothetical protein EDM55_12240 [Brevibacillus centrosporus]|nr:hypothetical protein EDM55_12240 [Brevibacillus centrosporus]